MVEFLNPPIGMPVSHYIDLGKLRKVCNSCIGFHISLGKLFIVMMGYYFGSHFRLVIVDLSWFFNCSTFFFFFFLNEGSTAHSDQEKLKCSFQDTS